MRFLRCLLIAIIAVAFLPLLSVRADGGCPDSDAGDNYTVNNTADCPAGNINSTDDQSNTITNSGAVGFTIFGGNATNASAVNTIKNLSGGSAMIIQGGSASNGFNLTNSFTNAGSLIGNITDAEILSGGNNGTGTVGVQIFNSGSMSSTGVIANSEIFIDDNASTGIMNEQVSNSGSMSAFGGDFATAQILTSANDTGGTLNTQVSNSGSMSATGDSFATVEVLSPSNAGTGTMSAAITNSGSMSAQSGFDSDVELTTGSNEDTGTLNAQITNSGSISAQGDFIGTVKLSTDTNEGTGTLNTQITNSGSISAQGSSGGTVELSAGSNEDAGTFNAQITNSGSIAAQGGGGGTVELSTDTNEGTGTFNVQITNSGSIFADEGAELASGVNESSGSMNVSIVNSGSIVANQAVIQASNNEGTGTVTNTITVSGSIIGGSGSGDIIGGMNTGGGTTTNTTILTGWNPTISGTIYGDSISPNPGALDQLVFGMQTTNEGQWDQWQSNVASLMAANGGKIPENGQIYWGGTLYKWQGIDEFEDLVKFILIVTWFNPNDGRANGEPADRIAVYCHADKNTLGVLLVNNDSAGNVGTSFDIKKLEALGKGGTSVSFGTMGILSIMMDPQGNGYAAWNGGNQGANGQGDFAKTFACPLP